MQQPILSHPLALFCAAAPEDVALLSQWETHLQPLQHAGLISFWSEQHLPAGISRKQEQAQQFAQANLILLLLSADFFSSPDCLAIMEGALERSKEGAARVVPLLLRPVAWQESALGTLAPWPSNGKPIMLWSDQDEGWHTCVQELRRLLGRRVSEALPSERAQQADPDWERMLRRLRRSYKELLDQSLHGIAWVELDLAARPEMVSNVTNLLFRLPQGGERLLTPGTSILDAFDEAEGELLILGAPGAGKSTLLLDLAQQLVNRVLADLMHPLPIILRLSSWALGRPVLADWMVDQLSHTYDVPRLLSERWVTQGRLLPLLDGLDEMEEGARPACIAAINTYHRTHLAPLVVCSRQGEYEAATTQHRLVLQSAIIVQPLSETQIENYLNIAGPPFAGVRTALQQEPALRELATTPLMLSVLLLTYRGTSPEEIIPQGTEWEQQVWTDYVARMVAEKGHDTRYPLERTRAVLSWLAQQMRVHQQTIFYAEYLQTDWLALNQQRSAIWLAIRLPAMVIGGCVGLLVFLLVQGESDYVSLLRIGLLGGFIGNSFSQRVIAGPIRVTYGLSHERWVHFRNALLLGVLFAASYGLSLSPPQPSLDDPGYSFIDWARDGCLLVLGGGLSFWIFQRLLHRRGGNPGRKTSACPFRKRGLAAWLTRTASPSIWLAATALGTGMGLSFGLIHGLSAGLSVGLSYGLSSGLIFGLLLGLYQGINQEHLEDQDRQRFNQGIRRSLRNGLLLSLISAIIISTIGVLSEALNYGLYASLADGLGYGLSTGLSEALSEGLSFGLSAGLRNGLNTVWIWLFAGLVVMWALSGGLTVLRHYVIRWLLARHHTFPWHAQAFLDDATTRILLRRIGGGYSFIHRRLQDYFADAEVPHSGK